MHYVIKKIFLLIQYFMVGINFGLSLEKVLGLTHEGESWHLVVQLGQE